MWRSLVAHYAGGVVVVGSNPTIPTNTVKWVKEVINQLLIPKKNKEHTRQNY
tara:strand:- start:18 stop:173 length:156 start_codon:yes stop_codon:yes gene_type:complete